MDDLSKKLSKDPDGMVTYEYIVNHEDECIERMDELVNNLRRVDLTGQFLASSARFLNAIDSEKFSLWIPLLIEGAIEKDKERRYIGSLLESIWGPDYQEMAEELQRKDDNFRRIYKRLFPGEGIDASGHLI